MPSHSQNTFRRKIKQLEKSQTDILVMHYACSNFHQVVTGFPKIHAIVLIEHGVSNGINDFSLNNFRDERDLLNNFFAFIERNKRKNFVHWNMNDNRYGLRAIESRYRQLNGCHPYKLNPNQMFDFDDILEEVYGKDYIDGPKKLGQLIRKNGLESDDIVWGADEAELFANGNFFKGQTSTLTKARTLDKLLTLYFRRKLKTGSPRKGIVANTLSRLENHPLLRITLILSALLGIIGFVITSIIQLG